MNNILRLVILFTFPSFIFGQVLKKTPVINYEIYDPSYNFDNYGFTYSTLNVIRVVGLQPFHGASFGAIKLDNANTLFGKTIIEDTVNNAGSACLAFNQYEDRTSSVWAFGDDMDGYFIFDDSLNIILNLNDLGIDPDHHGIAKLSDGRYAYLEDTTETVNFASPSISDTTDWPSLAQNVMIFDPTDSSTTEIFNWFSNVDSFMVIPEYLYEGDLDGTVIDWTHPNSIFEDYDGNILISWRHLGICKMDVQNGNVLWWAGLPDSIGIKNGFNEPTCISGDCRIRLQHDLKPIKGMPNYYSTFDNGDSARAYSRALFFTIDPINNTMEVTRDKHFELSNFMGSLDVFPDESYLVNVPSIGKLPYDRFADWNANGQFQDSIGGYIHLLGSDIFLVDSNDSIVAKYWSDSANFVYSANIIDFSDWNTIYCSEDTMFTSSDYPGTSWLDSANSVVSSNSFFLADGADYRVTFPYGVTTGYSARFNSSSCVEVGLLINYQRNNGIIIYPNPGNSIVSFSEETELFEVRDLLGKIVHTANGGFMDVSQLNKGVYWINGRANGREFSTKFIKN